MLISRKEARARGLKRYFNGKPCKKGHVCERYTRTAHCVDCDLVDRAQYREKNRQIIRARGAEYRAKHRAVLTVRKREQRERKQARENAAAAAIAFPPRPKAKPIPPPDWAAIGYSVDSIQRRAAYYRDAYRKKKKTG